MSKIAKSDISVLRSSELTPDSTKRPLGSRHTANEWATRISGAQSEEQLLTLANAYLATWLPSDSECLPAECQFSSVSSVDELAHVSVTVVKAELCVAHDAPASSGLIDLVRVFVAGQQRLRQLRSRKYDPSAG